MLLRTLFQRWGSLGEEIGWVVGFFLSAAWFQSPGVHNLFFAVAVVANSDVLGGLVVDDGALVGAEGEKE